MNNSTFVFAPRLRIFRVSTAVAAMLSLLFQFIPSLVHAQRPNANAHWVGTWAAGPAQDAPSAYNNQTLRLIVHTSLGGSGVRVRLSNEHGAQALTVSGAHIAVRDQGANVVAGTDRVLTFSGNPSVTIPNTAAALSDPVYLTVPASGDLAVSLYLSGQTSVMTIHPDGHKTSYLSPANGGDASAAVTFPLDSTMPTMTTVPILSRVEVLAPPAVSGIVILGASISEGHNTTVDANTTWANVISNRLQAQNRSFGVTDVGISGNRVRNDDPSNGALGFGQSALGRLDRDALTAPAIAYLILLEGHNDIQFQYSLDPAHPETADDIIAGYRQVIARAHAVGVKILGCTLSPNTSSTSGGTAGEAIRQAVNAWVRSHTAEYDAFLDCDLLLRDPSNPGQLNPAYNSGDGLHPNDAGHAVMGNAVDLTFFQ